jgi:hypothetical protein
MANNFFIPLETERAQLHNLETLGESGGASLSSLIGVCTSYPILQR